MMRTWGSLRNGLLVILIGACGDKPATNDKDGSTTDDTVVDDGENGPTTATGNSAHKCSDYEGLITQQQAAMTPREEWEQWHAELLALDMAIEHAKNQNEPPPIIAPQDHFQRVAGNKAAIESSLGVSLTFSFPTHEYRRLDLYAEEEVLQAMEKNTFMPIRCPNERYGIVDEGRPEGASHFSLTLDGVYNVELVAGEYENIAGIDRVEPGHAEGGSEESRFIQGEIRGEAYYYDVSIREPFSDAPSMEYYYCSVPGEGPQEYDPAQGDPCESGR